MSRLTTLFEHARIGKQFKRSLLSESSTRVSAHARGTILGQRSSTELVLKQAESYPRQEEAVLNELLEQSAKDTAFPLSRLFEHVLDGDKPMLEEVLRRMQEKGMITLERDTEGELGAKLTLKGAVVALYGDWLLESSHDETKPSLLQTQPSIVALKTQRHA